MKRSITILFIIVLGLAGQSHALDLSGTITKDHKDQSLKFNLVLGDKSNAYELHGRTVYTPGLYEAEQLFDAVEVTLNGAPLVNQGQLKIYPRVRKLNRVTLAGLSLNGSFLSGWFDKGFWLEDLVVNNAASAGCLDYNSWNGKYSAKDGCSFGQSLLGSSSGSFVFNYDSFLTDNVMALALQFGDLKLEGSINYSKTYGTKRNHEGKGRITISRVISQSTANFNASLLQSNGAELSLENPSHDEALRRFIAFLELMALDVFVE